jgi:crotonobetainyl-CoA:carnitine CoA-transferase CaiB-like acyl-CoA transferase
VRFQHHPQRDDLPTVANPVRFSGTPVVYERAAPMLGEHNAEVLADWLGYSARDIDALHSRGTI